MASARVARGRRSQALLAEWFQARGWPDAKAREASLPGVDVYDMPGWAPEVKATEGQDFTGALRQARANSGDDIPFVVYRPRGYGPEKIGKWVAAMDLEVLTAVMQELEELRELHGK